jgi:hypothetical protein
MQKGLFNYFRLRKTNFILKPIFIRACKLIHPVCRSMEGNSEYQPIRYYANVFRQPFHTGVLHKVFVRVSFFCHLRHHGSFGWQRGQQ